MPISISGNLTYAPGVKAFVTTNNNGVLDISQDIVEGNVTRNINAVSTASFVLNNKGNKYDRVIERMNPITVFAKRINWVQIFTGYVTRAPFLMVVPGTIEIDCQCSLKRLINTFWDAGTIQAQSLLPNLLNPTGAGGEDGGSAQAILALLQDVVGWDPAKIHIQSIPQSFINLATTIYQTVSPALAPNASAIQQTLGMSSAQYNSIFNGPGGQGVVAGQSGSSPGLPPETNFPTGVSSLLQQGNIATLSTADDTWLPFSINKQLPRPNRGLEGFDCLIPNLAGGQITSTSIEFWSSHQILITIQGGENSQGQNTSSSNIYSSIVCQPVGYTDNSGGNPGADNSNLIFISNSAMGIIGGSPGNQVSVTVLAQHTTPGPVSGQQLSGFVPFSFSSIPFGSNASAAANNGSVGAKIASSVIAQIGGSYVPGAETPAIAGKGASFDCCLVPETLVQTTNGPIPIIDIASGDEVLTWKDGYMTTNRVLSRSEPRTQEVFRLSTNRRTIDASGNHPFHLIKSGRNIQPSLEWTHLEDLKVGDYIVTLAYPSPRGKENAYLKRHPQVAAALFPSSDFMPEKILKIEPLGEKETYDIEVEGSHNFIANEISVHNSGLASWACAQAGISLAGDHQSSLQWAQNAPQFLPGIQPQPGDLMYFSGSPVMPGNATRTTLTPLEIAYLWIAAGGPADSATLITAVCIALDQSGGVQDVRGWDGTDPITGKGTEVDTWGMYAPPPLPSQGIINIMSWDTGLWQINSTVSPAYNFTPDQLFNGWANAQCAVALYKADNFNPWNKDQARTVSGSGFENISQYLSQVTSMVNSISDSTKSYYQQNGSTLGPAIAGATSYTWLPGHVAICVGTTHPHTGVQAASGSVWVVGADNSTVGIHVDQINWTSPGPGTPDTNDGFYFGFIRPGVSSPDSSQTPVVSGPDYSTTSPTQYIGNGLLNVISGAAGTPTDPSAAYNLQAQMQDYLQAGNELTGSGGNTPFNTAFQMPNIDPRTFLLNGTPRGFLVDQPVMQTMGQLVTSALRCFQSAPNGDFVAWYPDYYGLYGQTPAIEIRDIEIRDFIIYAYDDYITTHVGVVGDPIGLGQLGGTGSILDDLVTQGIVSVQTPKVMQLLWNVSDPSWVQSVSNTFLNKYGMRPYVLNNPQIGSYIMEFFAALMTFIQKWADQYSTPVGVTFMPEAYPGMIASLPDRGNLQVYIQAVSHTFSRTNGFTTAMTVTTPTIGGLPIELTTPNSSLMGAKGKILSL